MAAPAGWLQRVTRARPDEIKASLWAFACFFALLAGSGAVRPEPWAAIRHCDSVVVDPHKHGLQPYGCGCVLFRDPAVGRFYKHESPYTYFTSEELHMGEISLECSRPGAAAVEPLTLHLHNVPMQVAAERGLPALVLLFYVVRSTQKRDQRTGGAE